MDKKNKNPNVPNLRFLQFTNEWSKFAVSELLNTYPTNSLSWDKLSYVEKSKFKNIHYGLIHNGFKSTIISGNNQFIPFVNNSFIPKSYTLLQDGDLILADASEDRKDVGRPVEMINVNNQKIISGLHTIHARNKINLFINGFKGFYFQSYAMKKQIYKIANGSKIYGISPANFNELFISVPSKEEQQKIVNLLQKIEDRIETQIKIIDSIKSQKQQIRNILFNDIHQTPNCCVQDYVAYEQPQKYIVHDSNYLPYSKVLIPVLTANQSFILGYTSENDGIYKKGDCIIFDDFTNESKYVNFPFKVKSSALKILQTKEGLLLKFFYEYLQFLNFEAINHKRHYLSEVAITEINVPDLKKQSYVCKVLSSVDIKLKNEEIILKNYKLQKHFLLANLFV